jgi:competence protein ComEA
VPRAALATAAALYLLAAWPEPAAVAPCAAPAREPDEPGRGAAVRCDGSPGPAPEGAAALLFGRPLDPNRASAADLELLPGIGPARAEAIEAARCVRPFDSVADLERVPGIGPVTRARIGPWLAVDPEVAADCTETHGR